MTMKKNIQKINEIKPIKKKRELNVIGFTGFSI